MNKYSVISANGLVFWVVNNETGQEASSTYDDRAIAQRICNQLNLKYDLQRI